MQNESTLKSIALNFVHTIKHCATSRSVMQYSREKAFAKLEAWARWELGNTRDKEPGTNSVPATPDCLPGDQLDYLTVESALKDYSRTPATMLRDLLLHVHGREMHHDSYEMLLTSAQKTLLSVMGWSPGAFKAGSLRRFTRFLGERLG